VCVFIRSRGTQAQKEEYEPVRTGQRLRFVRKTRRLLIGANGPNPSRVSKMDCAFRRPDGTEVVFIPGECLVSFDVGEVPRVKVAPETGFCCRPTWEKSSLTASGSRFGRSPVAVSVSPMAGGCPAHSNAFTHGYAVTSHSSQSKTVDEVLLSHRPPPSAR